MATRRVLLELAYSKTRAENAAAAMMSEETTLDLRAAPKLSTVNIDESFPVVAVPRTTLGAFEARNLFDTDAPLAFDAAPEAATYLVRGEVEEGKLDAFEKEVAASNTVVGFYADPEIQPMIVCPGSAPVGTDTTVESLLCTSKMHSRGMDGKGVLVAIVDSGVNMAYLNSHGKTPNFDAARSWAWSPSVTPGSAAVGHGTMCAYDVCIAAPKCTILDIALLRPISAPPGGSLMQGLLSDAVLAYQHLIGVMQAPKRPGEARSLVVNNSWGMFHPSWDWPVGHPANYSDNPNHPFNRIVATLARYGADILFAAGNCGANCPDSRCQGVTSNTIYGANSSGAVLCVAGVDTTKQRVGYSAIGPGRLTNKKPDVCGYTHFSGSGVYAADGGTSAATPVVAGVVAAIRSKRPYDSSNAASTPSAIRNLITSTAQDLGTTGYDYQHGYGVVDGCKLADKVVPVLVYDICKKYPWLCKKLPWWDKIKYPIPLPEPGPFPKPGPLPDPGPIRQPAPRLSIGHSFEGEDAGAETGEQMPDAVQQVLAQTYPDLAGQSLTSEELAFEIGYRMGRGEEPVRETRSDDCGCKGHKH